MVRERSYHDLVAWQKGMDFVEAVYRATRGWPKDETFGLVSQARRAAVSIPANIAEGQGRSGPRELLHYLSIAHGSLCEAETHLLIARRLDYLDQPTLDALLNNSSEVGRILQGFIRSLR